MAEPKKETVRIALPPRPEQAVAAASNIAKRDTARIVLPSRTPVSPIRRLPPAITPLPGSESPIDAPNLMQKWPPLTPAVSSLASPLLQPLPKPPGTEKSGEGRDAVRPGPPIRDENATAAYSIDRGLKKETARISILPRPAVPAPAINMTKTQPLFITPSAAVPAPVIITSKPVAPVDAIPRSLAWALLAISAVIFLIQIWNYVVS